MPHLEAEWVFVARPTASIRIEKETFLVFVGDVIVQILCDRKLSMELYSHVIVRHLLFATRTEESYLIKGDAVVL
jgi:hypothetical protein